MKLDFTRSFADALAAWRRDGALLLPVAGLTMFLPQLAILLLVPSPSSLMPDQADMVLEGGKPDPATVQATADALTGWATQYGGWYALAPALALFGALAVMALYLMPQRPTVAGALGRAAVLFLRYLLASILIGFAALSILLPGAMSGLLLAALMPLAFYVLGRTMLVAPVIVGEAPVGAIAAIQRSWQLTRGNGWMLGATYAAPLFAAQLIGGALLSIGEMGGANPVIAGIVDGLAALVLTIATLLLALVEIALYRRLASTGT
ncbi:MAG: hypothetical protein V4537_15180 [Pseudomonadota bacterium]